MSHTLTNYNGVQIVTPENDLTADRQALNANFKYLTNNIVLWVQASGTLAPVTPSNRVLLGGATDDGVSFLQVGATESPTGVRLDTAMHLSDRKMGHH